MANMTMLKGAIVNTIFAIFTVTPESISKSKWNVLSDAEKQYRQ